MVVRWSWKAAPKQVLAASASVALLLVASLAAVGLTGAGSQGSAFAAAVPSGASSGVGADSASHAQLGVLPKETVAGAIADWKASGAASAASLAHFEPYVGPDPAARLTAFTADGPVLLYDDALAAAGAPKLTFLGTRATHPVGEAMRDATTSDFLGNDPAAWRTGIPQYDAVRYPGLWAGIDLVVRLDASGHLEFDHVAAAGADLAQIRLFAPGAWLATDGHLHFGASELAAPTTRDASGRIVPSAFTALGSGAFGYTVAAHDGAITIDPVLRFSTYHGTSGDEADNDIAVTVHPTDPSKLRIYAVGRAVGTSPPTYPQEAGNPEFGNENTVGVSAMGIIASLVAYDYDPAAHTTSAAAIVHLGGSGSDEAKRVAIAPGGKIVIAGETSSTNFPILFPIQSDLNTVPPTYSGGSNAGGIDFFVARLTSSFVLDFATYIGSNGDDFLDAVATDGNGRIGVAGHGDGANYPTKFPWSSAASGGDDMLVSILIPNVSPPIFEMSTFVGDADEDLVGAIAMDNNNIWVGGSQDTVVSSDAANSYATPGAFQTFHPDGPQGSAFIWRMNRNNPGVMQWATYISGSGYERVTGLTVVPGGNVWVAGTTTSLDLPTCNNPVAPPQYPPSQQPPPPNPPIVFPNPCTVNTLQPAFSEAATGALGSPTDAFVALVRFDGGALFYSSYWGGAGVSETPTDLLVEPLRNHVILYGSADATAATPQRVPPTTPPAQTQTPFQVPAPGAGDAFLLRFRPFGWPAAPPLAPPFYVDYIGTSGADIPGGMAVDGLGNLYLSGGAPSPVTTTYPLVAPVQTTNAGGSDSVVSVVGQVAPAAILKATYASSSITSSQALVLPCWVGCLPQFPRNAGETVDLDASLSQQGDFPLKTANYRWTLYDLDGSTVILTDVGGNTPSFSPVTMTWAGERIACVEVRDDGPIGHPDGGDKACVRLIFSGPPPPTFTLSSPAFVDGGNIPMTFACDGGNLSPPLEFTTLPAGTVRFAVAMTDLDAVDYVHWVWWDLDAATTTVPQDANMAALGITVGRGTNDASSYAPICPPAGETHTYLFRGYALNAPLGVLPGATKAEMEAALSGKVLAADDLTGRYAKATPGSGGSGNDPPAGYGDVYGDPYAGYGLPDEASAQVVANTDPSSQQQATALVAYAGDDLFVSGGGHVTLDGSGSQGATSYSWRPVGGGANVDLTGANTARAAFTAPAATSAVQVLRFQLTASNAKGESLTDEVQVTIEPGLAFSSADAGTLSLTFQSNQPGLLHHWSFGDGSSDSGDERPVHRFPAAGTYTVRLTVAAGEYQATTEKQVTVDDGRARTDTGVDGNGGATSSAGFPLWALLALIPGIALLVWAFVLVRRRRGPGDQVPPTP